MTRRAVGPTARLAQVATRAQIPNGLSPPGCGGFQSRSMHCARQDISSLQLVLPNFFVGAGSGEMGTGGPGTYRAGVEYPAGRFTQACFGGAVSGAVANGAMVTTDPVAVSIPDGATFWVRLWYRGSRFGFSFYMVGIGQVARYDALTFGSEVADLTMGGAVATTDLVAYAYPAAIIAHSVAPSMCLFGDSRVFGLLDVRDDDGADGGELARLVGPRHAYIGMGISGDTAIGTLRATTNREALGRYCSTVVVQSGINDVTAGAAAGRIAVARARIAGLFPGASVFGTTLAPWTESTDGWATEGNQTVCAHEAERVAFNEIARAGIGPEVDCVDIADALDASRSGRWPANGTAGFYTSDGVHETANANRLIACSPALREFGKARAPPWTRQGAVSPWIPGLKEPPAS